MSQDNIVLIDKPEGWSSFDVVKKIKNIGRFKKVGHAGTLDPFATGLLILGTGTETKTLSQISASYKAYEATAVLGYSSDTFDITGNIRCENEKNKPGLDALNEALNSFLGEIQQIPPMFSAKKVNGQRLYKLARKGVEVKREAQTVHINEIRLMALYENEIRFYVNCSKGTYVRTLAHDLGVKLDCGAYLKNLRRVQVGEYHIEQALSIEEFQNYWMRLN